MSDGMEGFAGPGGAAPSVLPFRFYIEAKENEAATSKEGRFVCDDVEMIEITVGRDQIRRPVTDEDRRQYAAAYTAWRAGQDQHAASGTPLREWPFIKASQVESLSSAGIRTVEQFAAIPDSTLQQVGPLMAMRQKARDWLEEAKKGSALVRLRSENDALTARVVAMEQMIAKQAAEIEAARANGGTLAAGPDPRISALEQQIAALVEAVKPAPPKRRGRPPKAPPVEGQEH